MDNVVFIKASCDIKTNLDFLIRNGLVYLKEDMSRAKPFNPKNPPEYRETNQYFNRANNVCMFSIWQYRLYDLCERYYRSMLQEIRECELKKNTNFNKGMVYVNLGVSQIPQRKFDEGFTNILKAHMEDEPYHKTDPSKG